MCLKLECPHKSERMCTCEPIAGRSPKAMASHMFQNISDFKMELDYATLEAPAPYRFCASGSCKVCGERLCLGVDLPDYLYGDGFLAVLYHHMKRLHMNAPNQFVELFREKDRPAVLDWLTRKNNPASRPKQSDSVMVYTVVQTSVDMDRGSFPGPFVLGSYSSVQQAHKRLAEFIEEAKKTLDSRYNTEDRSDDS